MRRSLALALLTACGARTALRCPVDARDAAVDTVARDAGPPPVTCHATLRVGSTEVPFGCVIDLRVGHVATLTYPCAGGAASAAFGDDAGVFAGTVGADGAVDLALDTRFVPGDGCTWVTHQTITGSLTTGSLDYAYSEMPAPGEHGCLPPCPVSRAVIVAGDAGAGPGATSASASVDCVPW